jgi:tetratricopeptide (TPR) repeat protein
MGMLDRFKKKKEQDNSKKWAYWVKKTVENQGGKVNDLQLTQTLDFIKFYECPGCDFKTLYYGKSNQPPLCPKCGRLTISSAPPDNKAASPKDKLQYTKEMTKFEKNTNNLKEAMELHDKANRLCDEGKYEEAIKWFDKTISIYAGEAEFWYNKGFALLKLRRANQALACFQKAVELNPCNADYWLNQGVSFALLDKFEEAVKCYNKGLELNPVHAKLVGNKFVALARLNRRDEAGQFFVAALKNGGDTLTREVTELLRKEIGLDLRIDNKSGTATIRHAQED